MKVTVMVMANAMVIATVTVIVMVMLPDILACKEDTKPSSRGFGERNPF